jgi:hypothetical protein
MMAVTMQNVTSLLSAEEPLYAEAARLGPDALPHLESLVRGSDPLMASKAAYLASLINHEHAADIVHLAARSSNPVIRVAAAAAAQNLTGDATRAVLDTLADDEDHGVRKTAEHALTGELGAIPAASDSDTPAAGIVGTGGGLLPGSAAGDRSSANAAGQGGGVLAGDRAVGNQAGDHSGQGGGYALRTAADALHGPPSGATTGQGGGSLDGSILAHSESDVISAANLPVFGGGSISTQNR